MKHVLDKEKSKPSSSTIRNAITQVDHRAYAIEEKINALNNELRKFRDQMSKMREGSDKNAVKAKVIRVLKQKKIYEQQLNSLRGQSFNMNQVAFAREIVKDTNVTVQAMKDSARQLKKEYKNVNIADIENVQDDLAEMMAEVDDIQETLGQCLYNVDVDEDEINSELDALGEEIALDDDTSYLDDVMKAPDASKDKIETEREKSSSKSNDNNGFLKI